MNKARILIVDDNAVNLKLAATVLESEGYEVISARDAFAAFKVLATVRPDLILMDISMPGMDGLTATRKLKAQPETRDIPVVAVTASAMKGDENKAIEAGCEGYIIKPIDTRLFGSQVARFLPEKEGKPDILS